MWCKYTKYLYIPVDAACIFFALGGVYTVLKEGKLTTYNLH